MPTTVEIPNVGRVEFPDGMSREEITKQSKRLYDESQKSASSAIAAGDTFSVRTGKPVPAAGTPLQAAKEATSALPVIGGVIGSFAQPGAGTALGAIGGKGLQIGIDSLLDPAEADRRAGLKGAVRTYVDLAKEGLVQGAFDYGGQLLAKGGSKILRAYTARYGREASVAARQAAASRGIPLEALEKVGPKITREEIIRQNVTKAINSTLDDISTVRAGQPLAQSRNAADVFELADENFHQVFSNEYSALDDLAKDAGEAGKVSGQTIKDTFRSLTPASEKQLAKKVPGTMAPRGFAGATKSDIQGLVTRRTKVLQEATPETFPAGTSDDWKDFIREAPPQVQEAAGYQPAMDAIVQTKRIKTNLTFEEAQIWRSKMLQKAREEGTEEATRAANRASMAIDAAMAQTAKRVGIEQEWRALNEGFKEGAQLFDTTFTKNQLKVNPELILDTLKNGRPSQALRVRDALLKYGGKDGELAFAGLQRGFAERLTADPMKLSKALADAGDETLNAVFSTPQGKETLKNLKDIAAIIDQVKISTPSTLGGNLHESFRSGLGLYLKLPFDKLDQGMAWAFTKIAENPTATKVFLNGLRDKSVSAGRLLTNAERALSLVVKGARIAKPNNPYLTPLDRALSFGNAPGSPQQETE